MKAYAEFVCVCVRKLKLRQVKECECCDITCKLERDSRLKLKVLHQSTVK